jgi:hypothetical protein
MEFEQVWSSLRSKLMQGMEVQNWTAQKGSSSDSMKILEVGSDYILIDAPKTRVFQHVSRQDVEGIWNIWEDYKEDNVEQEKLVQLTRYSKYVISLLHWWESI